VIEKPGKEDREVDDLISKRDLHSGDYGESNKLATPIPDEDK
jgi:hypothetical protein